MIFRISSKALEADVTLDRTFKTISVTMSRPGSLLSGKQMVFLQYLSCSSGDGGDRNNSSIVKTY